MNKNHQIITDQLLIAQVMLEALGDLIVPTSQELAHQVKKLMIQTRERYLTRLRAILQEIMLRFEEVLKCQEIE